MSLIFILFISLGLGLLWTRVTKVFPPLYLKLLIGLISTAPLIMILNLIFKITFKPIALILCIISLVGLILERKKAGSIFKSLILESPVSSAILIYLLVVYGFDFQYIPHHWDEFSYWLTYPKQMLHFQSLIHPDFPAKTFATYLPGLLSLQVLNQTLDFNTVMNSGIAFNINYLFIVASSWAIWEEMQTNATKTHFNRPTKLILFFLALFVLVRSKIFIASALVETSCFAVMFGFFWSLYLFCQNRLDRRALLVLTFFFMMGGYALKEYFILAPGVVFVLLATLSFKERSLQVLKFLKEFIFVISGFLIIFVLWKLETKGLRPVNDFASSLKSFKISEAFSNRSALLGLSFKKGILHFLDVFILIFPLWGFYQLIHKKFLTFWLPILSFFAVYTGTLMWWYFFVASDGDALILNSFERYMNYFFVPIFVVSFLHFVNEAKFKTWALSAKPFNNKLLPVFAGIMIAGSTLFNLRQPEPLAKSELEELSVILQQKNQNIREFKLIDQNDNGYFYQTGLFYSFDHPSLFGKLGPGWAYSIDNSGPNGYIQTTNQDFLAQLQNMDVLWIRRSNEWLNQVLSPYLAVGCTKDLSFQFLIKENDLYECHSYKGLNREH